MSVINTVKRTHYPREDHFSLMLLGMEMAWERCKPTALQSTVLLPPDFGTFSFSETWAYQQGPAEFWKTWYRNMGGQLIQKGGERARWYW